jgi:hypothetical protein
MQAVCRRVVVVAAPAVVMSEPGGDRLLPGEA